MNHKLIALSTAALLASFTPSGAFAADPAAKKTDQSAASQTILSPDTVAAVVNGRSITVGEIDKQLKRPEMATFYDTASKDPKMLQQMRAGVLNSMVNRELLMGAANSSTVITEADVKKGMDDFVSQQGGRPKIEEVLKARGMTWDSFEKDMRDGLKVQLFVERDLAKTVKVVDADVRKAFDAAPDRFASPETVRARHILLGLKPEAKPEEVEAAKKKADDLYTQVTKGGASFETLATANSDDPGSKANGGDLGFFPRGMMVPDFEKVAFETAPGKVAPPIKTQFGFHIIKVEEKKAAEKADFEKVRAQIEQDMLLRERSKLLQTKLEEMRSSPKVEFKVADLKAAPGMMP
jgi:parvulin-like peptidyl-prolyl isomerase